MLVSAQAVRKCLEHIAHSEIPQAREIIEDFGEDGSATRTALEGLIASSNGKSIKAFWTSREKMLSLKASLSRRSRSIWADDYDKNFSKTWIDFLEIKLKESE
ncbi:MAG: hypothetical protein ACE5KG_01140 [Nitrososphaerales archaeon]